MRIGDPTLFSVGKEESCISSRTKTPQGRMMCPWGQECCPILNMKFGREKLDRDTKDTLRRAHLQTGIHVDEDPRETMAREQDQLDELHERVEEKKRLLLKNEDQNDERKEKRPETRTKIRPL